MLEVVRDKVFPHFRRLNGGTTFGEYMNDAQLMIQKPSLLVSAVNMIDALPITEGDAKGDLYEYLLSKLTTAGINGQFRTPRHIIRFMVEMLDPKPTETVGDPACGTAGFLVGVMLYLLEKYSSPKGIYTTESGEKVYTGDKLEPYREHIQSGMFHGFDFDSTMLRIASMNLMLHGVDNPDIHYQDTLSNSFPEKFAKQAREGFDVILANPPFKGSLDAEDVHPSLTQKVKTKKTELLFIALILRMLKKGGRSATIVPDGVLFGSSKAHVPPEGAGSAEVPSERARYAALGARPHGRDSLFADRAGGARPAVRGPAHVAVTCRDAQESVLVRNESRGGATTERHFHNGAAGRAAVIHAALDRPVGIDGVHRKVAGAGLARGERGECTAADGRLHDGAVARIGPVDVHVVDGDADRVALVRGEHGRSTPADRDLHDEVARRPIEARAVDGDLTGHVLSRGKRDECPASHGHAATHSIARVGAAARVGVGASVGARAGPRPRVRGIARPRIGGPYLGARLRRGGCIPAGRYAGFGA